MTTRSVGNRRSLRVAAASLLLLGAACAGPREAARPETPNALPPVDDPLAPAVVGPRIKPTDKPTEFPNLAAQPAPREPSSTEAQKREIRDSLVADRDRAQYSADDLRGGAQPAAAPPAPAGAKPATPVEKAEEKSGGE